VVLDADCRLIPFADANAMGRDLANNGARRIADPNGPRSVSANKESAPSQLTQAPTEAAPQRYILPKNLRNAVKHLSDGELDLMHAATVEEMRRRGRTPSGEPGLRVRPDVAKMRSPTSEKRRHVNIADVPLTRGQVNAVRAAFKAGITPSRIARQFGFLNRMCRRH
jgi:hypothetical protein